MALNEKMLPIGKTKTERTGDYLYTMEVVGWNESEKSHITVDADPPMRAGSEPLVIIHKMM